MDSKEKICPFCEGIFGISEIKDHIGIEHLGLQSGDFIEKEEAAQFKCEVCSTSFISEISLQKHAKFAHSKDEKCGKKTIDKEESIAKFNPKMKAWICETCNKRFTTKSAMTFHKKTIHRGERLNCPKCSKTFTQTDILRSHIRITHEAIKLDCPKCEKSFGRKHHLNTHMRTVHDGIKLDCPKCDKSFTQGHSLRAHVKRFHEGLKLKCDKCDKRFGYKDNLKAHMKRTHNVV